MRSDKNQLQWKKKTKGTVINLIVYFYKLTMFGEMGGEVSAAVEMLEMGFSA